MKQLVPKKELPKAVAKKIAKPDVEWGVDWGLDGGPAEIKNPAVWQGAVVVGGNVAGVQAMPDGMGHFMYNPVPPQDAKKLELPEHMIDPEDLEEMKEWLEKEKNNKELEIKFKKQLMLDQMTIDKKYLAEVKQKAKEDELECNLVRIDLDNAAERLAKCELDIKEGEDVEMYPDYLEVFDKYYDLLFKSKA